MDQELDDSDDADDHSPDDRMYAKYSPALYGPRKPGQKPPLSTAFLKKFLKIAKNRGR